MCVCTHTHWKPDCSSHLISQGKEMHLTQKTKVKRETVNLNHTHTHTHAFTPTQEPTDSYIFSRNVKFSQQKLFIFKKILKSFKIKNLLKSFLISSKDVSIKNGLKWWCFVSSCWSSITLVELTVCVCVTIRTFKMKELLTDDHERKRSIMLLVDKCGVCVCVSVWVGVSLKIESLECDDKCTYGQIKSEILTKHSWSGLMKFRTKIGILVNRRMQSNVCVCV